jgi:putative tricarboxylic transport membrane protein
MVLGLVILSYLASGSVIKAMIMAAFGIFLGNIGVDIITGKPKFNLGIITLMDGIGLIPVVMGLFGIGEVLFNIEKSEGEREILQKRISNFFPNLKDWMESIGAIIRGTVIGFFLGILPGG